MGLKRAEYIVISDRTKTVYDYLSYEESSRVDNKDGRKENTVLSVRYSVVAVRDRASGKVATQQAVSNHLPFLMRIVSKGRYVFIVDLCLTACVLSGWKTALPYLPTPP